ncbi:unnamed protein product [Rotaria sp. Silwood1]|nr:unnamed protein product [Rotaria sp. Silwood1]
MRMIHYVMEYFTIVRRGVDCIDGGIDEQNCGQFEINECNDHEYRCHNGQCILEEFLWNNLLNPDCLDGTDETIMLSHTHFCAYDPSFRCEDLIWRPRTALEDVDVICGDGSYNTYTTKCVNKRDLLLKIAIIQSTSDISTICRDTMVCLTDIEDCKTKLNITHHCPELFQFPGVLVLF